MKSKIKIEVPDSWSDVTLKKFIRIQKDMEIYSDDEEAQIAFLFHHLCNIDIEAIQSLSKSSYEELKEILYSFLGNTELPLQKIINVNGKEYGFEPNLSKMSYGAFVDITKYDKIAIDDNWNKIIGILYRPIESKKGETYIIEPYTGKESEINWNEVSMDIHFGVFFYLLGLLTDLLNYTLKSMKTEEDIPQTFKQILERNGQLIQQSLNLHKGIFSKLKK